MKIQPYKFKTILYLQGDNNLVSTGTVWLPGSWTSSRRTDALLTSRNSLISAGGRMFSAFTLSFASSSRAAKLSKPIFPLGLWGSRMDISSSRRKTIIYVCVSTLHSFMRARKGIAFGERALEYCPSQDFTSRGLFRSPGSGACGDVEGGGCARASQEHSNGVAFSTFSGRGKEEVKIIDAFKRSLNRGRRQESRHEKPPMVVSN